MRVVYDTNILLTLTRREELMLFKEAITSGQLIHVTSLFILEELERVLVEKFEFTRQKAKITTRVFAKLSVVVTPLKIEKVSRDPFDDHILATAKVGHANYIVTADKDLLVLGTYKEIDIVTAASLRELLVGRS